MDYTDDSVAAVRGAAARLRGVTEADAAKRPAPGKWSAKEVIGHLIDSAAHNHQRFVRARWQDDLSSRDTSRISGWRRRTIRRRRGWNSSISGRPTISISPA